MMCATPLHCIPPARFRSDDPLPCKQTEPCQNLGCCWPTAARECLLQACSNPGKWACTPICFHRPPTHSQACGVADVWAWARQGCMVQAGALWKTRLACLLHGHRAWGSKSHRHDLHLNIAHVMSVSICILLIHHTGNGTVCMNSPEKCGSTFCKMMHIAAQTPHLQVCL
jgi:hypothetical protein